MGITGEWKTSKKVAQRDAAERALGLLVNQWGELMEEEYADETSDISPRPDGEDESVSSEHSYALDPVKDLEQCCSEGSMRTSRQVRWTHASENGSYRAFVEIVMF